MIPEYKCDYCDLVFKHKQSKTKHQKKCQKKNKPMKSIEWLIKELYIEMNMKGDGRVLDEILKEAKEMHKKD